jgi:hypothetical protein
MIVRRLLTSHSHILRQDKAELSDTSDLACVLSCESSVFRVSKPRRQSAVNSTAQNNGTQLQFLHI